MLQRQPWKETQVGYWLLPLCWGNGFVSCAMMDQSFLGSLAAALCLHCTEWSSSLPEPTQQSWREAGLQLEDL